MTKGWMICTRIPVNIVVNSKITSPCPDLWKWATVWFRLIQFFHTEQRHEYQWRDRNGATLFGLSRIRGWGVWGEWGSGRIGDASGWAPKPQGFARLEGMWGVDGRRLWDRLPGNASVIGGTIVLPREPLRLLFCPTVMMNKSNFTCSKAIHIRFAKFIQNDKKIRKTTNCLINLSKQILLTSIVINSE